MGQSLDRGHVAALSLWDDVEVNMLWLDSAYPLDKPSTEPGVLRGDCPGGESSTPTYLRKTHPDGHVTFANVAIGEIGSTLLEGSPPPAPTPAPTPVPTPTPTPAPTPSPTTGLCKPWCSSNPKPWSKKCQWEKCSGCPDCTSG